MSLFFAEKCAEKNEGFTIVEILMTFLLISIFTTLSFPAWQHLVQKNRVELTTQNILRLLKTSRQFAIQNQQEVIVCLSLDKTHCQTSGPINHMIARSNSQIVGEIPIDSKNTKITWRSNLAKNDQLVFMPTGMTNGQQGHFGLISTTTLKKTEVVVLMNGSIYVRAMNLSMAESK